MDENVETPLELGAFEEYKINVWPGWWPLLADAHARLSVVWPGYRVWDVKEKWGDLRINLTFMDEEGNDACTEAQMFACEAIVQAIEARSHTVCEECGADGATQHTTGYWIKTFCAAHAAGAPEVPMQVTRMGNVTIRSFTSREDQE